MTVMPSGRGVGRVTWCGASAWATTTPKGRCSLVAAEHLARLQARRNRFEIKFKVPAIATIVPSKSGGSRRGAEASDDRYL
jgi:hypothetical protein